MNLYKIINKPGQDAFQENEPMVANLVPDDGMLLTHLSENLAATKAFIGSLPADKLLFRYAPGKWTIKEILGHLIDMERVYGYRALRFARNDQAELPGFDADEYVLRSGTNDRPVEDLLAELDAVRQATLTLLDGFESGAFLRTGVTNGHPVSVGALAYHIAGHEVHHINIIRERYC